MERWNAAAKKVAEIALREALALGDNYVGPQHLMLALKRLDPCSECGKFKGQ